MIKKSVSSTVKNLITFGRAAAKNPTDVYAENVFTEDTLKAKVKRASIAFSCLTILLGFTLSSRGNAAVNVSISTAAPASLQGEFLTELSKQYLLKVVPSQWFANTFSVTLYGKNPAYQPPAVSTTIVNLDTIANKLVRISSDSYVYGWAAGMEYERQVDLGLISNYLVNCSTPSYFVNRSSFVWTSSTCNTALGNASMAIYQQDGGTPIVIPPLP